MNIVGINSNLNFGARVIDTPALDTHIKYLADNFNIRPKQFSTEKNYKLMRRILGAFSEHPSNVEIYPAVIYEEGKKYGLRSGLFEEGRLKISSGVEIVDIEPAKTNGNVISPLENIFKKLLAPENKGVLDKVFGKEYTGVTKIWYEKHIKPIWDEINSVFGESSIYEHSFDNELNRKFRETNI